MGVPSIIQKLEEYSHASEISDDYRDPDVIRDQIESCQFGHWVRTRTWRGLPKYLLDNGRFAYLLPR